MTRRVVHDKDAIVMPVGLQAVEALGETDQVHDCGDLIVIALVPLVVHLAL